MSISGHVTLAGLACGLLLAAWGCADLRSFITTEWSENYALSSLGSEASHPALNDGNVETVGETPVKARPRELTILLPEPRRIRRILITNDNLYYFSIDYWDASREQWRTLKQVWQRRDVEGRDRVVQPIFEVTRVNFETDRIRLRVTRTVDDIIVSKVVPAPDDKIVDRIRKVVAGSWVEYYRVWIESPARVREIQLFGVLPNTG